MTKKLASNVEVEGTWYGPDYPDNKVTADVSSKITSAKAWEAQAPAEPDQGEDVDPDAAAARKAEADAKAAEKSTTTRR